MAWRELRVIICISFCRGRADKHPRKRNLHALPLRAGITRLNALSHISVLISHLMPLLNHVALLATRYHGIDAHERDGGMGAGMT